MIRQNRVAVATALALFLLLGWSNAHHWDEYFYLYSSYLHSPAELLRYELQTTIFPPGFFTEKIGHVVLLRLLTTLVGAGERVLYGIELLYALLLAGYLWASYKLLQELFGPEEAGASTLVLAFSPVTLYLAYKILSEIPSLLFVTLGSWLFVRSFTAASRRGARVDLASALLLLALGALCRITSIVGFAGLGIALLMVELPRLERRRLLARLVLSGVVVGAMYALVLASLGGDPMRVVGGVDAVLTTHPPLERAFALATFLQTFALVLPFVWAERARPEVRIAAVWLVCAALPFVAGHEARYYAPALIPFALLSAFGFRRVAGRLMGAAAPRHAWLGLLAALVLTNRVLLIPLMPYEVEQGQLLSLFHRLQAHIPNATFLLPWISDYSLLRFSSPASRVDLCLSEMPASRISHGGYQGGLPATDRWWAGADRYVGSRERLAAEPRPWEYIGWTYNPADVALLRILARLGFHPPSGAKLHNHLIGSWIWSDPTLILRLLMRSGQYDVYQVGTRTPPHP
ncbi:MAG: glycosyltransferase family 39 protein [Gemmatimonadales bacterium]